MSLWQKTKSFIGFDEDLLDTPPIDIPPRAASPAKRIQRPPRNEGKLLSFPAPQRKSPVQDTSPQSDVVIIVPKTYEDSLQVSTYLKKGNPVIVNIKNLDNAMGKRFIDFVCGSAYAFNGNMHRLGGTIFIFTPEHMGIVPLDEENMDMPPMADHIRVEEMELPLTPEQDDQDYEYIDPLLEEQQPVAEYYASAR